MKISRTAAKEVRMKMALSLTATIALVTCLPVAAAPPPTEEEVLQVLAQQTFLQLHDVYVTLPDLSTERVARSSLRLPVGWPVGEMKGLVKQEYVEDAFLEAGLSGLDDGTWIVFQVTDLSTDVVIHAQRDQNGEIEIKASAAMSTAWFLFMSPLGNGCGGTEGGDDDFACNCGGSNCDASCATSTTNWTNTGQTTEGGNQVYESIEGQTAERCGDGDGDPSDDGIVIVLSPL